MKRLFYLTITVLMLSRLTAAAQEPADLITLRGEVRYSGGETVEAAIVSILQRADSAILAYAMTDSCGRYAIRMAPQADSLLMRVTGFNIRRQIRPIAARSARVDFTVEDESMVLREVQIKAQKLWGNRDTLNYLVSAYTREHDRTIGDVLKQLPGITIDNSGIIRYQGVAINHFYIENLDLLQGRYTLATEGIKAEDVATVQVLENHEHIKALQDQVPPESAAINLKLKKKAKGIWTGNADLGLGADGNGPLWDAGLQAMYFGKGRQHLLRYGGDNLGQATDAASAHYGRRSSGAAKLLGIVGHGASPVGNSTLGYHHDVNLNNLTRLSDDVVLHYNLNYRHGLSRGTSYSRTTYVMPDGTSLLLTEDLSDRTATDKADLQLTYEKNAERRFLNNTLSLAGNWDAARGTVVSNTDNITQKARYRSLSLSNSTRWVNRTGQGGGFTWTSVNSLSSSPQSLSVGGDMQAWQEVDIMTLSTDNDFELVNNLRARRWTIAPSVQVDATGTTLSSRLQHSEVTAGAQGDMRHLQLGVGIGPVARYVKGTFRATLRLPLSLSYIRLDNAGIEGEQTDAHRVKLRLQPSFSLLWKATDLFTFDAGASCSTLSTPWPQLFTAYLMNNYRNLSRYRATIADSHGADAHLKVSFKHILNRWFAHVNIGWARSWSDQAYGTTLDAQAHTVVETRHQPNSSQHFTLTGYARKDIDWHSLQLEATATATRGKSGILRQSVLTEDHTDQLTVQGKAGVDIVPGYRLEYNAAWNTRRSRSTDYSYKYSDFTQQGDAHLRIVKSRLYLNLGASHTHNRHLASRRKDYVFLHAGLMFKVSRKLELNVKGDNLTNLRSFISRSTGDLESYYSEYHLRPWSVTVSTQITL